MLNLDDFEKMAEKLLTEQGWAYYRSSADDETSYDQNGDSYNRIWFKPRVLRKVTQVDAKTQILEGKIQSSLPIYISPAALAKLGHPEGELNLTRAAGRCGIVQGVSERDFSDVEESRELDHVRREMTLLLFFLYFSTDLSKRFGLSRRDA